MVYIGIICICTNNTLSGIYFQQRIIILGLSHQASPKTLPEPKQKIQRYSEWQASTKAFKIIVDTLEFQSTIFWMVFPYRLLF